MSQTPPDWSCAMVVNASGSLCPSVASPATHASTAARDVVASSDPIRVRCRDAGAHVSGSASVISSTELSASASSSRLGRAVGSWLGGGRDATFWVPDPSRGEVGLLEAIHRRGEGNRTPVLLQSRPLPELQHNFSTCTGLNIDLSHTLFRLSKVSNAFQHMHSTLNGPMPRGSKDASSPSHFGCADKLTNDAAGEGSLDPSITVSARTFASTVRAGLQALQEEDYYLVRYRDYSAWAVRMYRELVKHDGLLGRRYVEQCFVVHVGREPGELIPITEAQFLFGIELLQRQLLSELASVPASRNSSSSVHRSSEDNYAYYQHNINFCALNADQYRSLGVVLGDGLRPVGVEADERKRRARLAEGRHAAADGAGRAAGTYVPPAWYDWSPYAIRTRVQHRLSRCYQSIGQLTVQASMMGVTAFVLYRLVRNYLPDVHVHGARNGGEAAWASRRHAGSRGESRGYWSGGSHGGDDMDAAAYAFRPRAGLWRSVLMGPKDVFDYLLAPSA